MIFDTSAPIVNNYIAPTTPKVSGGEKTILSLLGYKDDGTQNQWGKIMPLIPGGGLINSIASEKIAAGITRDNDNMIRDNIKASLQSRIKGGLALAQFGAGVGMTAAGMPQGIGMAIQGLGQGINYAQQEFGKGGYIPGGSHKSGNDIALVDSKTGEDTGMRVEGDELLFNRHNSDLLRKAIDDKDLSLIYHVVQKQMSEGKPKQEGGEYGEGTNYAGLASQNNQQENPYAYGYFGADHSGKPIFDTYQIPTEPYVFGSESIPTQSKTTIYGDPSTWGTINGTMADASSTTPPPTSNGMGNYWNYIPGAAQTLIGLSNVNQKVPNIVEPNSYADYVSRLHTMANQGYTPQERALINGEIERTYQTGIGKAKAYSGGNAPALLATLNMLGQGRNEALLKSTAEEQAIKRQNLLNYGSALSNEINMFNLPNQEWARKKALLDKEAAASLANTGIQNMQSAATYNNLYNSPEYAAMLAAYKGKQ